MQNAPRLRLKRSWVEFVELFIGGFESKLVVQVVRDGEVLDPFFERGDFFPRGGDDVV